MNILLSFEITKVLINRKVIPLCKISIFLKKHYIRATLDEWCELIFPLFMGVHYLIAQNCTLSKA